MAAGADEEADAASVDTPRDCVLAGCFLGDIFKMRLGSFFLKDVRAGLPDCSSDCVIVVAEDLPRMRNSEDADDDEADDGVEEDTEEDV